MLTLLLILSAVPGAISANLAAGGVVSAIAKRSETKRIRDALQAALEIGALMDGFDWAPDRAVELLGAPVLDPFIEVEIGGKTWRITARQQEMLAELAAEGDEVKLTALAAVIVSQSR